MKVKEFLNKLTFCCEVWVVYFDSDTYTRVVMYDEREYSELLIDCVYAEADIIYVEVMRG